MFKNASVNLIYMFTNSELIITLGSDWLPAFGFNMKTTIILILLAITQCYHTSAKLTTMKISDRIRLLKKQIRNSLRNPSPHRDDPIPTYYESSENSPIKPILDNDELKKDDRFRLKKIKSPATIKTLLRTMPTSHSQNKRLQHILQRYKHTLTKDAPNSLTQMAPVTPKSNETTSLVDLSIFYRRSYDKYILENTQEWMHCSEHVAPYLKGAKKELTKPKKVQEKDHIVHRLLNLIKANTTRMTRAEKKTTMYQISKLKIRLYSWDLHSMEHLVTLIARLHGRSPKVDLLSIKTGLKNLLASWQADLSNTTTLLYQARVFRPPCIPRGTPGSSKFVRGSTMSSMSTPSRFADSLECRRSGGQNGCK